MDLKLIEEITGKQLRSLEIDENIIKKRIGGS